MVQSDGAAPAPTREELRGVLELATRAPSMHNSQPWRFRIVGDRVQVLADHQLAVADASGWATRIACGAAALHIRLGYALLGWRTDVLPFPDPAQEDLLLAIRPVERRPPSPTERRLVAAIPRRHSNRGPFRDEPMPASHIDALQGAATAEAAWLDVLDPARAGRATTAIGDAADILERNPEYREELRRWSAKEPGATSGVQTRAAGPLADRGERLRRRDFGGDRTPPRSGHGSSYESDPVLAVLGTNAESPFDDLRAGQALERVLLTAADLRLSASMLSQPIEVESARARLAALCAHQGAPQMVLRIGYGEDQSPSGRRPVDEVLDD